MELGGVHTREAGRGLIARFALGGFAAFLVTSIGVSAIMVSSVRGYVQRHAEVLATSHAASMVNGVLASALTPADLSGPITGSRYQQLQRLVDARILSDGWDVRVKIWIPDGTVIFSDDQALIGQVFAEEQPKLREVMAGTVQSGVVDASDPENVGELPPGSKMFETSVPLRLVPGGPILAVADVYQNIALIKVDIPQLFRTLVLGFGGGLLLLYLMIVPVALRASRSLRRQNAELKLGSEQLAQTSEELRQSFDWLRATEEQRRNLLHHVISAQEEERQRIAENIHDDSLQKVTAVGLRLGILRRKLSDPEQLAAVDQLQESVDVATARLRNLLFELHPRSLDGGLADALREHLDQANGEGVAYELENRLVEEPPLDIRIVAFRIAQEALSNVHKHAEATHVSLTLTPRDEGFLVAIEDDGVGFDPLAPAHPGHLGLASMRERAEMAGGRCTVESSPGSGTRVECWLPKVA